MAGQVLPLKVYPLIFSMVSEKGSQTSLYVQTTANYLTSPWQCASPESPIGLYEM